MTFVIIYGNVKILEECVAKKTYSKFKIRIEIQ